MNSPWTVPPPEHGGAGYQEARRTDRAQRERTGSPVAGARPPSATVRIADLAAAWMETDAGIVIGIHRLIDMGNTTINVTGDMVASTVVARSEGWRKDEAFGEADGDPSSAGAERPPSRTERIPG